MNKEPKEILSDLKAKFDDNFLEWKTSTENDLGKLFSLLYSISEIGLILRQDNLTKHQELFCNIYDEIFSDTASSIFLAASAIDKPASIILRRVLELGVATLYLWDMPHAAYSWSLESGDLSFSEMLSHLCSDGYIQYVKEINNELEINEIIEERKCQKLYGRLSDIVHGKITTFESVLPDRFTYSKSDWDNYQQITEEILEIIVKSSLNRFSISSSLFSKQPNIKRYLD